MKSRFLPLSSCQRRENYSVLSWSWDFFGLFMMVGHTRSLLDFFVPSLSCSIVDLKRATITSTTTILCDTVKLQQVWYQLLFKRNNQHIYARYVRKPYAKVVRDATRSKRWWTAQSVNNSWRRFRAIALQQSEWRQKKFCFSLEIYAVLAFLFFHVAWCS